MTAEHGTYSRYTNDACRCRGCAEACRLYMIKVRARHLTEMIANEDHRRHGTEYGYRCGCRCPACTTAKSRSMAAHNNRKKART